MFPGTRRVGWVASSTRIQRYNKNSNYQKYFHNFCKFLFRPLRKRFWPTGTGPDRLTLIFPGFSFYGHFGRRMVCWSTFAVNAAKSPEIGHCDHNSQTADVSQRWPFPLIQIMTEKLNVTKIRKTRDDSRANRYLYISLNIFPNKPARRLAPSGQYRRDMRTVFFPNIFDSVVCCNQYSACRILANRL